MPLLDDDDLERMRAWDGAACNRCGGRIRKNYCRQCDEFFLIGHREGCALYDGEHRGHRTYWDGYVISYDHGVPDSIEHVGCGFTSHHKADIAHRYCGHCHQFLDLFILDGSQAIAAVVRDALRWPGEEG